RSCPHCGACSRFYPHEILKSLSLLHWEYLPERDGRGAQAPALRPVGSIARALERPATTAVRRLAYCSFTSTSTSCRPDAVESDTRIWYVPLTTLSETIFGVTVTRPLSGPLTSSALSPGFWTCTE